MSVPQAPDGHATRQLVLATGAFAVCFAVFGSVAGMMPVLTERLRLTELQVGVALAVPILLGSLGRIPLGMLADRMGGRRVFLAVMLASLVPAAIAPAVESYTSLLVCLFFLGIPLAVFSVGVAFVSGWYPPASQGMALGVYGAGNIGQSLALFGAPLLVAHLGFAWGFWFFGLLTATWAVVFYAFAVDAPRRTPARGLSDFLVPLSKKQSWELSLYYFLTFGGFLAMASYLPKFLILGFGLTRTDAGFRAAGFVVLATLLRPVGGWLSDRVGGRKVLLAVFPVTAAMALLMAVPTMPTFTIGALGMAAAVGLGNGAVFKLVPEYFPASVGTVTGLVGAAGGLGGFFPPLALGLIRESTGTFTMGFVLLSAFALACWLVCFLGGRAEAAADQPKAPAPAM